MFLWLLPLVFMIGADAALLAYQIFHLHRFSWTLALNLLSLAVLAYRYGRLIYRRLDR